ncbi:DNA cytosine methyltransferase [Streptomyces gardneri]|uniref:DNA cytosine methyltransferase n=1 Tax=Streptomyces gardneri TaxID=66892 RepID=UPI0036B6EC51
MAYRNDDNALTVMDWFCGAGGSSQGMHAVPGIRVERAANHWERAIQSHEANFPDASHYRGDIREAPVWAWPVTDLFWASPECTNWSIAKGKKRDFDKAMQGDLLELYAELEAGKFHHVGDDEDPREPTSEEESRALMEEVPLYLRGVIERGGLVKAGVVENVVDVRQWTDWDRWIGELHKMGYRTRIIALNSMHANPRSVHAAPQSRDRLYVAYWHESLGRTPDWDKWLRPRAWCSPCDTTVAAVQWFKQPGRDMGRYRQQYLYRCPTCRTVVEPEALPALAAIDWSIPGQRIGDRTKPLADKTLARIKAGLEKFARPITLEAAGHTFERRPGVRTWPVDAPLTTQTASMTKAVAAAPFLVPSGGTWRTDASSVLEPMPTRTTRENDALVVPPLLVPVEGRDGKEAASALGPLRTQTARNETGLAWLPFIAELRGGGSVARPVTDALATVTASGNHHGLVTPAGATEHMLIPYYGTGVARPVSQPMGALTTRDRYALVQGEINLDDVMFRMLEPHEIGRAMSFADDYVVLGSKRERVKQYGNAVTPNASEILVCALVEAITGEDIERYAPQAPPMAAAE